MPDSIVSLTLYLGGILALTGVVSLTILQFRLIGRLEKSFFSIFSVIFYPNFKLSNFEQRLKRLGILLLVIGGFFVFIPMVINKL